MNKFNARKVETDGLVLNLPFPPPANNLFKNIKGGRAKTEKYRAWQAEAGWAVTDQRNFYHRVDKWTILSGPIALKLILGRPDKRKRDLDNLLKAPIDLLVKHGVIDDDRNVQRIEASWGDVEGMRIEVRAA